MKNAIVFGVTGQTGSYWVEFLLEKNIKVIGVVRRVSTTNKQHIQHINNSNFIVEEGDITDMSFVSGTINKYKPTYCINMAAQSHVHTSFEQPINTFQINAVGVLNILESIRKFSPNTRFLQASSSEMFGSNFEMIGGNKYQTENTPLSPNSPYAVSKVAAHELVRVYRESYCIFGVSSIAYNHESPRRGDNFVTKKITNYIKYLLANQKIYGDNWKSHTVKLNLGNLDARRDWSHAKDIVSGQWLALTYEIPDDYVFATGQTYTIRQFLDMAFGVINLKWEEYIHVDTTLFRPMEVPYLCGYAKKAQDVLGWTPQYELKNIIEEMINGN